jgi:hypothetical protein
VSNDTNTAPRISTKFILEYFGSSSVYAAPANQNNVDVFSAKVSAAGVVSDENVDWISGNCAISITSSYTCTFNTSIFSAAPSCTMTALSGGAIAVRHLNATTSTTVNPYTFNPSSGAALAASFQIICQKQGADFTATRLITGQFKELMTVPNVTKPKTCYYAFGGASATLASPTECTVGTCVEVVDTCGTVTVGTSNSAGSYIDFTFANGTFSNNSPVHCTCTAYDTTINTAKDCVTVFQTGDSTWSSNSNGGYVANMATHDNVGTFSSSYVQLKCEGQAP